MDASTAALAPSLTVVDRRPSPVARHRVAREAVADPLLLCALFASSTTGTPRPPGSVAMLPSSSPSPSPVPAAHHLSGLGCFFVAPWPSDKHPGSDLNWAFVSAAGGRLIRSGMAQAGPSQPSARGKALCSKSRRIVAPCCNDRQERSLWRQAFPRRHWLDRCETRAKHAGNRQPAPASANLHQQSLSGPDCCRHIQHLTPNTWSPPTWCPLPLARLGAGRQALEQLQFCFARPVFITSGVIIYCRHYWPSCSTHCCQRLPKTCRAAHLRRGRQRQRDSTSPALSPQPKSSTLGLLHLHTFLDSVDSAHHITTPS
jgi:hypothetical protein